MSVTERLDSAFNRKAEQETPPPPKPATSPGPESIPQPPPTPAQPRPTSVAAQASGQTEEIFGTRDFRRLGFMVYWTDAPPSGEVFYIPIEPGHFNPTTILELEARVTDLVRTLHGWLRVSKVICMGELRVEMSASHIEEAGWHVLRNSL